jgi:hypothetical protein
VITHAVGVGHEPALQHILSACVGAHEPVQMPPSHVSPLWHALKPAQRKPPSPALIETALLHAPPASHVTSALPAETAITVGHAFGSTQSMSHDDVVLHETVPLHESFVPPSSPAPQRIAHVSPAHVTGPPWQVFSFVHLIPQVPASQTTPLLQALMPEHDTEQDAPAVHETTSPRHAPVPPHSMVH